MLEREIEVGHARRDHRLDQLVRQARGIEVEQPGALHAGGDGARQCGDRRGAAGDRTWRGPGPVRSRPYEARSWATRTISRRGGAIGIGRGTRGQRIDLGQYLVGGARTLLAPEGRDGAKAADSVAPLGHLHVGPRGSRRRPRQLEEVEPRPLMPIGVGPGSPGGRRALMWAPRGHDRTQRPGRLRAMRRAARRRSVRPCSR